MPPRSVRNGRGPVSRFFGLFFGVISAAWLGLANAVGAAVRGIGKTARDLDPEHRRDGFGFALIGAAVVVAGAVWWQVPGGVMDFVRTMIAGSVGKVAWLVPLLLLLIGWRNLRNPERNGPV
ncbi:MAG: DNA translocase FtsK, partial [Nocardioides sp.]